MSTISKLDPRVRLDRYLRKQMLRDMQADLAKLNHLMARGQRQLKVSDDAEVKAQVTQLFRAKIVTQLMLGAITKIVKDNTRSGQVKETILAKLGSKGP